MGKRKAPTNGGNGPVSLFPPKKRRQKPQVVFRAPPDIEGYLKELKDNGYKTSEVVVRLLRLGRAIEAELGDEWDRVQAVAPSLGATSDDVAAGKLVLIGLVQAERDKEKRGK